MNYNNEVLISVIIPVYNVEKYLDKCIKSVIVQSYKNIEIVLVDDGSTDSSSHICDEFAQVDKRIRVIHKENGGPSEARNYGIEIASGQYICFVDSDDYVEKEYVEYLYNLMNENSCDIAISPLQRIYNKVNIVNKSIKAKDTIDILSNVEVIQKILYGKVITHEAVGKLFPIEYLKKIKFPIDTLYEDYATTYLLINEANKIAVGYKKTYYYCIRQNSIMTSSFNRRNFELIKVADYITDYLINLDEAFIKSASRLQVVSYCEVLKELLFYNERNNTQKYINEKNDLKKRIKSKSQDVLMDKRTAFKDKIKIISLFMGEKCFKFIYKIGTREKSI